MMSTPNNLLKCYNEGAERWKEDHKSAMRCFEIETLIKTGIFVYTTIVCYDSAWQSAVAEGKAPFDMDEYERIGRFYKKWIKITKRELNDIKKLSRQGLDVVGADDLQARLDEAREILDYRALDSEMRPVEELLTLASGNPRPDVYGA